MVPKGSRSADQRLSKRSKSWRYDSRNNNFPEARRSLQKELVRSFWLRAPRVGTGYPMDVSQVLWQRVRIIGHREPEVSLAAHISARSLPRTTEKETISPLTMAFLSSNNTTGEQQQAFPYTSTRLRIGCGIPGLPVGRFADRLPEGGFHSQTPFVFSKIPTPPAITLPLSFFSQHLPTSISFSFSFTLLAPLLPHKHN